MILQDWAETLCTLTAPDELVALHRDDTRAAYRAGLKTDEGKALARLYAGEGNTPAAVCAIARASECDDIHLPSCVTPGAIVMPIADALAKGDAEKFRRAAAAGYAAGIALGASIGGARALAHGVWPALLAAPLMAAVTASCARGQDAGRLAHAMALALAGSNGRPGRPIGAPSGRWFLLAESVARGIAASRAAISGFTGDLGVLSPYWLAAQAGHDGIDMDVFERHTAISEVGFKPFPIARQAMNAVAAFRNLLDQGLDAKGIDSISVFVPPMHVALLTRPISTDDRLSRLCNMGFQLACAALAPEALYDAERRPATPLLEFARRVTVAGDPGLETHLPDRWPAKLVVKAGQRSFEETLIRNPFDADAPGLAALLHDKWRRMPQDDVADALWP